MIMKIDLYFSGTGNDILAKYAAELMGVDYDSDGLNTFVISGISVVDIPREVFKKRFLINPKMIMEARDAKTGNPVSLLGAYHA